MKTNSILAFVCFLSIMGSACSEPDVSLKSGPKMSRVLNEYGDFADGTDKRLQEEEKRTQAERERQKQKEELLSEASGRSGDAVNDLVFGMDQIRPVSGAQAVIRFTGNEFSLAAVGERFADQKELPFVLSDGGRDLVFKSYQPTSREAEIIAALEEDVRFRFLKGPPILIRTKSFVLKAGEKIHTNGRDIIIISDRVETDGEIVTTPLRSKANERGLDAGDIKIAGIALRFGPESGFDATGGSGGELICPDDLFQPHGETQLTYIRNYLLQSYYRTRVTGVYQDSVPPELLGFSSEERERLIRTTLHTWEGAKGTLVTRAKLFERYIYPNGVRDTVEEKLDDWRAQFESADEDYKKQKEKTVYRVGDKNIVLIFKRRMSDSVLQSADTHAIWPLDPIRSYGYVPGGSGGLVAIYSPVELKESPENIRSGAGPATTEGPVDYAKKVLPDEARWLPIVEKTELFIQIKPHKDWDDKTNDSIDSDWVFWNQKEIRKDAFQVSYASDTPAKLVHCPTAAYRYASVKQEARIVSRAAEQFLKVLEGWGIEEKDIPPSFKKAAIFAD